MAEESMKTKGRNKFLLCFRPLVIDGALTSDGRLDTGDPVFAYIAVAEEGNLTILSPLSEKERSPVSEGKMAGRRHRKSARRIFSRMVKAVLLSTLSKKSVRDGKVGQDPYRYDSSLSTESENSYSSDEKSVSGWRVSDYEDRKINSTVSSSTTTKSSSGFSSSLISSSSISSSSSLNACPWPMPESKISRSLQNNRSVESKQSNFKDPPQKTNKTATARCYSFNFGLFLLLISFSVMIFWGRVCAILCTSTWFYFVVRRVSDDEPPESVINSPEIDTKEYKKRVIMEGLLERGHRL